MENNNTVTLLNEGAIQDFIRSVFGRNFKSSVGAAAEVALNKALTDVVSGGRKFTIAALRKTPEYKTAFKDLTLEASRVKYGKSFDDLVKFDKNAAQKLINDVQTGIEKQIADNAAVGKNLIDGDVKAATGNLKKVTKDVNLGKATAADLKAATKELKANVKAQTKWADAQKAIAGMDKISVGKLQKLLAADAKVTTGSGTKIAGEVGQNVVVQTRTGIFTMTKDQLKKFPGAIKKVVVNNKMLSTLAVAGLSVAALYYFFGATDDSSTILVDENGNPLKDDVNNEWGECLNDIIKSNDGRLTTTNRGSSVVLVNPTDKYPKGLVFYSNNRVQNLETKDMGTWSCKGSTAVIAESVNDVVKRVLKEKLLNEQITDTLMDGYVDTAVDDLDGYVAEYNLKSLKNILLKLKGKTYNGKDAISEFLRYYSADERGDDFISDVKTVGVANLSVAAKNMKEEIIKIASRGSNVPNVPNAQTPKKVTINEQSSIDISWDKDKDMKKDGGGAVKKKSSYRDCEGEEFPLAYGCKSTKIAEVQKCLGVAADGKLGPKTMKAIVDNKYDTSRGLSKDVYDAIKTNCVPVEKRREKIDPINLPVKGLDMSSLASNSIKMPDLSKIIQMNPQPVDLYQVLMDEGYIEGDSRSTVLDDGTIIPATKRVKYKGPDLEEDVLGKLDGIMLGMGYDRIKQKLDKRYGAKYVWLQK